MTSSPFLNEIRAGIRLRNYSIRTEKAYVGWAKRFIRFHGNTHPAEIHDAEVVDFLTHLAVNRHVSANTQNQALNALVFMYRHVIKHARGDITSTTRARQPKKLPVVLTRHEVSLLLTSLNGINRLFGSMLYGSGLRIKLMSSSLYTRQILRLVMAVSIFRMRCHVNTRARHRVFTGSMFFLPLS